MDDTRKHSRPSPLLADAWASLHILLFLVLPEGPQDDDGDSGDCRRGNVTAWFIFWGMVAGVFAYGLIVALMKLLSLTDILNLGRLSMTFIPFMGLSFLAPVFASWFGTPRLGDALATACAGRPSIRGIVVFVVWNALCFLMEFLIMQPLTAIIFYLITLLFALAVPHVMAKVAGGTTSALLAVSGIVLGVAQLVSFVFLGV